MVYGLTFQLFVFFLEFLIVSVFFKKVGAEYGRITSLHYILTFILLSFELYGFSYKAQFSAGQKTVADLPAFILQLSWSRLSFLPAPKSKELSYFLIKNNISWILCTPLSWFSTKFKLSSYTLSSSPMRICQCMNMTWLLLLCSFQNALASTRNTLSLTLAKPNSYLGPYCGRTLALWWFRTLSPPSMPTVPFQTLPSSVEATKHHTFHHDTFHCILQFILNSKHARTMST